MGWIELSGNCGMFDTSWQRVSLLYKLIGLLVKERNRYNSGLKAQEKHLGIARRGYEYGEHENPASKGNKSPCSRGNHVKHRSDVD